MTKIVKIFITLTILWALTACATTHLVSTWRTDQPIEPLKKVLVIGISDKTTSRRLFEDIFVQQLEKAGLSARASYLDLPDAKEISRESVEKLIKGTNFDSVLVTHYEGTNEEMVYQPGTSYGGYGYNNPNYWGYYNNVHSSVYTPGYYVNYKFVYLETKIYEVTKGEVIWSARSETTNMDNMSKSIHELSAAVIANLKSTKLIN